MIKITKKGSTMNRVIRMLVKLYLLITNPIVVWKIFLDERYAYRTAVFTKQHRKLDISTADLADQFANYIVTYRKIVHHWATLNPAIRSYSFVITMSYGQRYSLARVAEIISSLYPEDPTNFDVVVKTWCTSPKAYLAMVDYYDFLYNERGPVRYQLALTDSPSEKALIESAFMQRIVKMFASRMAAHTTEHGSYDDILKELTGA